MRLLSRYTVYLKGRNKYSSYKCQSQQVRRVSKKTGKPDETGRREREGEAAERISAAEGKKGTRMQASDLACKTEGEREKERKKEGKKEKQAGEAACLNRLM